MRRRRLLGSLGKVVSAIVVLWTSSVAAFKPEGHVIATENAVSTAFTGPKTRWLLVRQNWGTDWSRKVVSSTWHFDAETFGDSASNVASGFNSALGDLGECNKPGAMDNLGPALHALQDFYAHSNWVENQIVDGTVLPMNVPFFSDLVLTGNPSAWAKGPLEGNPGLTTANFLVCGPDPGPAHGPDLAKISSGYFRRLGTAPPPQGKCSHGELNKDNTASPRGGFALNGSALHLFAMGAAERHTAYLIDAFRQAVLAVYGQQHGDELLNFLFKDQRDLVFCIDDTQSMAGELPQVKARIVQLVGKMADDGESPILTLLTFKDTVTYRGTTCSPSEFNNWISALSATAGGDCPEASLTALTTALAYTAPYGILIVATDASPREGREVKDQVVELARKRGVTVHFLLTGDCGGALRGEPSENDGEGGLPGSPESLLPAVETYRDIAAHTGGYFFQSVSDDDVDDAIGVIIDSTVPHLYDVTMVEGELTQGVEQILNVPIDTTVQRVEFVLNSLDGGTPSLEVRRPDGTPVSPSDPDADVLEVPGVERVRITSPAAGAWTMAISGDGAYSASAKAVSAIGLVDFVFFTEQGPPERPAWVPLTGVPGVGDPVQVQANTFGAITEPVFALTLPDGTLLETLSMSELTASLFQGEYTASSATDRFLVRMTGTDTLGAPFQRVLRRSFKTSTLAVRPPQSGVAMPGCPAIYTFEFENRGPADTFSISATSESGFPVVVYDPTLTIASNGVAWADIEITIPRGTDDEFADTVAVTATSTTDATVTNTGAVYVVATQASDCNGNCVPDDQDVLDGNSQDCNANGVPDECDLRGVLHTTLLDPGAHEGDLFGSGLATAEGKVAVSDAANGVAYLLQPGNWEVLQTFDYPAGGSSSWDGPMVIVGDRLFAGADQVYIGGQARSGVVYVFDTTSGQLLLTIPNPSPHAEDHFGFSVGLAGDKVVVGAPGHDEGFLYSTGIAYVFSATTGQLLRTIHNPQGGVWDLFGHSVAGVGGNVAVGAPYSGAALAGAAYLFDGATGQLLHTWQNPQGDSEGYFGVSLVDVGGNVLVGAPGNSAGGVPRAGAVYLFSPTTGQLVLTIPNPTPEDDGNFGFDVAAAGNDVLVADSQDDEAGPDAGAVYLFDGSSGELLHTFLNPAPTPSRYFGWSLGTFGDEILAGALANEPDDPAMGAVYVLYANPGTSEDCNSNGIPDECDIDSGATPDANTNGVPDPCEADCNDNGTLDRYECFPGDYNRDGDADLQDFAGFQDCFNTNGPAPSFDCACAFDLNADQRVDLDDFALWQPELCTNGPQTPCWAVEQQGQYAQGGGDGGESMMGEGGEGAQATTEGTSEGMSEGSSQGGEEEQDPWTYEEATLTFDVRPVGGGEPVTVLAPYATYELHYACGADRVNFYILGTIATTADEGLTSVVPPTTGDWSATGNFVFYDALDEYGQLIPAPGYPDGYYRTDWAYDGFAPYSPEAAEGAAPQGHLCNLTTGGAGTVYLDLYMEWSDPTAYECITLHAQAGLVVASSTADDSAP